MRTKLMIAMIILGCTGIALGALLVATLWAGWVGAAAWLAMAGFVLTTYVKAVRPWHARWGATDEEVARVMPGDDLIPGGASTTRAITINARPRDVWPWLVQLGYGRAGWYSYDWIDNDGNPSAVDLIPHLQTLAPGDMIPMLPGFGPRVAQMSVDSYLLAGDAETGTWCLALRPEGGSTRLVTRWRQDWNPQGIGARFFVLFSDPGAFIMERKMLLGIKQRAEAMRQRGGGLSDTQVEVALIMAASKQKEVV